MYVRLKKKLNCEKFDEKVDLRDSALVAPSNDGVYLVKDAILLVATRRTPSFDGATRGGVTRSGVTRDGVTRGNNYK
jgi:hypothetical protein